jgi:hypothetical protein
VTSVISLSFLLVARSHGDNSPTAPAAPSLRSLVPSSSLLSCQSVQDYYHSLSFHIMTHNKMQEIKILISVGAGKTTWIARCSHNSGSYSVCSLFLRFGGCRPLHNIQTFIFRSLMEVPTVCFRISSSTFGPKVLLNALLLPSSSRSCKSRSLISLLHSWLVRCLLSSVRPLRAPLATLSLPGL